MVRQLNNVVNIAKFQHIRQEKGESITQFAAWINGAANICDFTIECSCRERISYSKHMQAFQLVHGLEDTDIQQKVLTDLAKSNTVDRHIIIKLAAAMEAGKPNSNLMAKLLLHNAA